MNNQAVKAAQEAVKKSEEFDIRYFFTLIVVPTESKSRIVLAEVLVFHTIIFPFVFTSLFFFFHS